LDAGSSPAVLRILRAVAEEGSFSTAARGRVSLSAGRATLLGMTTSTIDTGREVTPNAQPVRSVEGVHRSTTFHWVGNGFHVSTYFPSEGLASARVSPFVLLDYGPPQEFTALSRGKRGVGWHPHRGFETVTLAWEGSVAHRDNAGNAGVIGPGDVQWMTAGAGIFHEEYHEEKFTRRGGRMHMMQLWVNLPKKDKGARPGYQPITAGDIPTVALSGGGNVRVLAGTFLGAEGPARTFTPITMLDVTLPAGAPFSAALPSHYNALAVVAAGKVEAGRFTASAGELLLFENDGGTVELTAEADAHVIVLAGEPIAEPIVQYGPFVMNAVAEIEQAIADVNSGKFGPIPE
jgi:quercetin 2,3-dioxygenase